jgi:hypothetical protein
MSERTAVGAGRRTRQGPVCPAEGCRGACECWFAPHLPRVLPISGPTVPRACDLRREIARCQGGIAIQAP